MSDTTHHALTELVSQFRRRAETARTIGKSYAAKAEETSGLDRDNWLQSQARVKGKASAYANAANELERVLTQTDTAPHKSPSPADPQPRG